MSERPILFSAEMVRAILKGDKTQTRRVMKAQPTGHHWEMLPGYQLKHTEAVMANGKVAVKFRHTIPQNPSPDFNNAWIPCPYGAPGDTLWVRETWAGHASGVDYAADFAAVSRPQAGPWRPSIHMPRWASRITLRITDVRVERLHDISEADARAEGCQARPFPGPWWQGYRDLGDGQLFHQQAVGETPPDWMIEPKKMPPTPWLDQSARDGFRSIWMGLHGPGAWNANPWVWVIAFERVKQ
ncbi:hypothetical protein UFOVP670_12 [uncultured Caudovirales phage]|uniref:Morphogenetic protein n=1 Tax=uncultured Caudovirales phage TaxID=2100421 RepID=A0A6J5NEC3_9CAUD|nr:hypothetical protein UFOVP670_12 [uncultured Caudovirales phage]